MILSMSWIVTLFFIAIRLGVVLIFTPIQAINQLPIHVRLLFIFSLSLLLIRYIPTTNAFTNEAIFLGSIAELAKGLILATSIYATFAIFQIAGQIIDTSIGLNATAIFDPHSSNQETLSSHFLSMLAVLFFFSLDGHQWLFQGLAYSFIVSPPGAFNLFKSLLPILKQFGFTLNFALVLAGPIILALLIVDLCGGLLTRNMPQINIYFVSLPAKIMLGLFLFKLMLNNMNPLISRILNQCFYFWQEILV